MKVLGTFDSLHDAEHLRDRLLKCGVETHVEGKHAASAGVYIPTSIRVVLLDERQFEVAKALVRRLDGNNESSRQSTWSAVVAAGGDRVVIGAVTVAFSLLVCWLLSSVL